MSDEPHPSAPAPRDSAALPATQTGLDANGFDPADYKWIPVARRERSDGWTADKQRAFIEALADEGSVTKAAEAVHMSPGGAYKLRRLPGGEQFKVAWEAAAREGAVKLADKLTQRAMDGVEEPIFYKGERVGTRIRYNDKLGMFLLRAHMPEVYDANRRADPADAPAPAPAPSSVPVPAPAPSIAQALEALTPETPADPHLLLPPEELEEEVLLAKAGNGKLPCWHDPVVGHRFQRERASALEDAKRRYGEDLVVPLDQLWKDDE